MIGYFTTESEEHLRFIPVQRLHCHRDPVREGARRRLRGLADIALDDDVDGTRNPAPR
jgi:hypothetical protein